MVTKPSSNHQHFKIIASDLDGTLLSSNSQLSAFTKATLSTLHQQGLTFVFSTGRHHIDVADIRDSAGIPAYMITSNGARVHDQQGNLIYSENIPSHLVNKIVDVVKSDPSIYINIFQHDKWLIDRENERLKQYHQDSPFSYQLCDVTSLPANDVAKIFFVHQDKDHEHLSMIENKLIALLGEQVNIAFSTPWCLEVMPKGVSKGDALNMVAQSMSLNLSNCIAFGDGMNDVEMLSMVGKGLVMGSAHHRVMENLPNNEVIGHCDEDAVAHYLQSHLLSK